MTFMPIQDPVMTVEPRKVACPTLRALLMAFAVLVVAFAAVAPQTALEVGATHQMTIRGVVYNTNGARLAGANIYLYNSSKQLVRSTTTDASGNYAIVVDKGYSQQLGIRKQYGTQCNYGGSPTKIIVGTQTGWFVPSSNWPNPTYANYQVVVLHQC